MVALGMQLAEISNKRGMHISILCSAKTHISVYPVPQPVPYQRDLVPYHKSGTTKAAGTVPGYVGGLFSCTGGMHYTSVSSIPT